MRSLVILILLLLGACSLPAADPEREAQATRAYELLANGRNDELRAAMSAAARPHASDATLGQMAEMARRGEPETSRIVTWTWRTSGASSAYETVQEFHHPDAVVVWRTTMVREGDGPWLIDGMHINSFSPAQAELARFSLVGRPFQNYVVLAGAILAPLVCLGTAGVAAWRRRWGWMILSLFGVGQVTLNWATGEVAFQAFQFAVLGAGFWKGAGSLDPWFVVFAVPLPAILFWALGRWRPKPGKAKPPATSVGIEHDG